MTVPAMETVTRGVQLCSCSFNVSTHMGTSPRDQVPSCELPIIVKIFHQIFLPVGLENKSCICLLGVPN